ncbi:MAG: DUF2190 family protein [Betaproteobacteria bacterium]
MNARNMIVALVLGFVASIAYAVDPATAVAYLPGIFNHDVATGLSVALPALAMMGATNYVQPGETITLTAPYTVVSGAGALVGGIFGVALGNVTSGDEGEFATGGVWDLLAVTAETFVQGDPVYWDNGQKKCSNGSTGNDRIGSALSAKSGSATTVRVRLDGISV